MVLKVFTQCDCPKCPAAKKVFAEVKSQKLKVKTEEFDVSTVDGLAEASFYAVMSTPSLILTDDKGLEVKSWRGEVPSLREVLLKLK